VWSADDEALDEAARQAVPDGATTLRFGESPRAEVRLLRREDLGLAGSRLQVGLPGGGEVEIRLPLPGLHNARNALAAMAVATLVGVPAAEAAERISGCGALAGRGRVVRLGEATVLDESYNSNPRALEEVLALVASLEGYRRKAAALGDMLELGDLEADAHEEAGRQAARAGVELLAGVGPRMAAAVEAARAEGVGTAVHFPDSAEAGRWLAGEIGPGDLLVVKGSRGMRMEAVLEALGAPGGGIGAPPGREPAGARV
jgi:UDP-N-acetylmuramoyl-tripeptide--D-alanyl-D-alanine ligase